MDFDHSFKKNILYFLLNLLNGHNPSSILLLYNEYRPIGYSLYPKTTNANINFTYVNSIFPLTFIYLLK